MSTLHTELAFRGFLWVLLGSLLGKGETGRVRPGQGQDKQGGHLGGGPRITPGLGAESMALQGILTWGRGRAGHTLLLSLGEWLPRKGTWLGHRASHQLGDLFWGLTAKSV